MHLGLPVSVFACMCLQIKTYSQVGVPHRYMMKCTDMDEFFIGRRRVFGKGRRRRELELSQQT